MITENLSTLKIHKLTQAQYDRILAAGNIDPNALYLTPDEENDMTPSLDSNGVLYFSATPSQSPTMSVNDRGISSNNGLPFEVDANGILRLV